MTKTTPHPTPDKRNAVTTTVSKTVINAHVKTPFIRRARNNMGQKDAVMEAIYAKIDAKYDGKITNNDDGNDYLANSISGNCNSDYDSDSE